MEESAPTQRERARSAHDAGAWEEAFERYTAAEAAAEELPPEDLERMGVSAWLVGERAEDALGRACDAFEAAGRVHDAARVALDLCDYHALTGEMSIAMGWLRRAGRMLESAPEGSGHARLAVMRGFLAIMGGKVQEALEQVERAHELARAHGDEDAEALSLSRRAALLLRLGRVEEASADVDEAMLLVHRDRVRPITGAMIYCNTIDFCRNLGDFERALEWTEAATRWTTRRKVCSFPGVCRVHHAELLRLRGEHVQAAAEVRAAIELFERHRLRYGIGIALGELGQQHLEVESLEEARAAFEEAAAKGHEALPGAAELALRTGDVDAARAMLETALEERADNPLGRARLLPTLVRACLATDDIDEARAAADELARTAERIGTIGIQAQAATAATRVHLAAGETREAIHAGRSATRAWNLVGACYELAQARELLAGAYAAAGDETRARLERRRARSTKDALSLAASQISTGDHSTPELDETLDAPAELPPLSSAIPVREGTVLADKIAIGPVLGVGGMGVVHAGEHRLTGRAVAVKVLKRSVCDDARHCARFLEEARACGRIRHPNVVDIYDAGMHGQEPYIVMERLEGRSLEERLSDGEAPSLDEALAICEQAARGVAAAHEAGVIHRDLKPGNIFVSGAGVKVLDFGISKQPEGGQTKPGQILGTPFYMAPEQIRKPDQVDGRIDVYALGAVLFELLAGRPPYVGESVHALLYAITAGPEADLRDLAPDVPEEVQQLVRDAIARDPRARIGSASELADRIAELREGRADA